MPIWIVRVTVSLQRYKVMIDDASSKYVSTIG